jgi:hypothetical protein
MQAGSSVAAAYLVFVAAVVAYVAILGMRLSRTHRELRMLEHHEDDRRR